MSTFKVWPYRFHFIALEPVRIPRNKAGNVFRGAFGAIFRRIACEPECQGAASCSTANVCPYAQVFEPLGGWTERSGRRAASVRAARDGGRGRP